MCFPVAQFGEKYYSNVDSMLIILLCMALRSFEVAQGDTRSLALQCFASVTVIPNTSGTIKSLNRSQFLSTETPLEN